MLLVGAGVCPTCRKDPLLATCAAADECNCWWLEEPRDVEIVSAASTGGVGPVTAASTGLAEVLGAARAGAPSLTERERERPEVRDAARAGAVLTRLPRGSSVGGIQDAESFLEEGGGILEDGTSRERESRGEGGASRARGSSFVSVDSPV